jgi:DNA-binding CsgD family transcriptional regulator
LGLSESEIAALKNVSYSAIRKQNESLQEKLGVDETISAYVLRVAEGLCATPNVEQEKQPDMDLQRTMEENSGQPMEMEQESSLKSSLKSSQKILELISASPSITISEIADRLGMTTRGVDKNIKRLKEQGIIRRVGPDKGGHWEVIE